MQGVICRPVYEVFGSGSGSGPERSLKGPWKVLECRSPGSGLTQSPAFRKFKSAFVLNVIKANRKSKCGEIYGHGPISPLEWNSPWDSVIFIRPGFVCLFAFVLNFFLHSHRFFSSFFCANHRNLLRELNSGAFYQKFITNTSILMNNTHEGKNGPVSDIRWKKKRKPDSRRTPKGKGNRCKLTWWFLCSLMDENPQTIQRTSLFHHLSKYW